MTEISCVGGRARSENGDVSSNEFFTWLMIIVRNELWKKKCVGPPVITHELFGHRNRVCDRNRG